MPLLTTRLLLAITLTLMVSQAASQVCLRDITPQTITSANFDFSIEEEAKDKLSGLTWKRCVFGQTWKDNSCVGAPKKLTWQEALIKASELNDSGETWRLPDVNELSTIIDRQCVSPPINLSIFPDNPASMDNGLWSSTPYVVEGDEKTNAWYINLGFGEVDYRETTSKNFVRFVTGTPQSF